MEIARIDPPDVGGEEEMLLAWLDYHRATLELKCAGLDQEALSRQSVPPSDLSLIGIVRHMTEVERRWFEGRFLGEEIESPYQRPDSPNAAFAEAAAGDAKAELAAFRAQCARSREIVAAAESLEQRAPRPSGRRLIQPNLRYVLVHLVEEYARHNGHADLLRETIDGSVGV
jgi:uncharacterized damage-inducible protein DinB